MNKTRCISGHTAWLFDSPLLSSSDGLPVFRKASRPLNHKENIKALSVAVSIRTGTGER
jgi:hypothetical protein